MAEDKPKPPPEKTVGKCTSVPQTPPPRPPQGVYVRGEATPPKKKK